jgi:hypothetical protein
MEIITVRNATICDIFNTSTGAAVALHHDSGPFWLRASQLEEFVDIILLSQNLANKGNLCKNNICRL